MLKFGLKKRFIKIILFTFSASIIVNLFCSAIAMPKIVLASTANQNEQSQNEQSEMSGMSVCQAETVENKIKIISDFNLRVDLGDVGSVNCCSSKKDYFKLTADTGKQLKNILSGGDVLSSQLNSIINNNYQHLSYSNLSSPPQLSALQTIFKKE